EVEAQHGDAVVGERSRDAAGREDVLAAGEAVREERVSADVRVGRVDACGELVPVGAGELGAFASHLRTPLSGPPVPARTIAGDLRCKAMGDPPAQALPQ